jgi:hypothetical protein
MRILTLENSGEIYTCRVYLVLGSSSRLEDVNTLGLGFFSPNPSDTWWRIDTKTSPSAIGKEIVDTLLQLARPEMETHMSDASLMSLWASGDSPGLTEVDRLKFLSVLLKLEGSVDALNNAKDALQRMSEGRPFAGVVALHLRRLDDKHHV